MNNYLRWYANLHKFYRILLLAAMGIGVLAVGAGMATDNAIMFFVGVCWFVGTPAVIYVAAYLERWE